MVHIEVAFGDPTTEEYSAAEQLRDMFERDLGPDEEGHILIVPNLFLWGERTRQIDLLVIGQLAQGFRRRVKCTAENAGTLEPVSLRNVYVKNLCWCVEVKDHERVTFQGTTAIVEYNGKPHDASLQSDWQLQSLRNFILNHARLEPYICNLIWFRNFDRRLFPVLPHNFIGKLPSFDEFLEHALVVKPPWLLAGRAGHNYYLSSCIHEMDEAAFQDFGQLSKVFAEAHENTGNLTREKVELITKKIILRDQKYAQAIGEKLVVIRGRAGTGKTIKLLRIAYDLYARCGQRCLILTYNNALVSDIRRLIALARVPDDVGAPTVDVQTVHSFLRRLMIG